MHRPKFVFISNPSILALNLIRGAKLANITKSKNPQHMALTNYVSSISTGTYGIP